MVGEQTRQRSKQDLDERRLAVPSRQQRWGNRPHRIPDFQRPRGREWLAAASGGVIRVGEEAVPISRSRVQQIPVEICAPSGGKRITADQTGQKRDDVGGGRVAGSLMQHHAADQLTKKLVPFTIIAD